MLVIRARNVNDALHKGIRAMLDMGEERPSRAGMTLEISTPVTTVYERPWERVLLNKERDANPFFHLFESLWILAGREDVKFLTEFNKRMADYSDNGIVFNAPYGFRMRNGVGFTHDQIEIVAQILRKDPNSRQAVLQIWDDTDLQAPTKDKACNMQVVFRIRDGKHGKHLDMTVYNRSNDMLWGAYGANMVQFSMLQEYMATKTGTCMGTYYQVSNSFHVYTEGPGGDLWNRLKASYLSNGYQEHYPTNVVQDRDPQYPDMYEIEEFEEDLKHFFFTYNLNYKLQDTLKTSYETTFFKKLAIPMLETYLSYKEKDGFIDLKLQGIEAVDWRTAAKQWIEKRGGLENVY